MAGKFGRGNSRVANWGDFVDNCGGTFKSDFTRDKPADDTYLKRIRQARGSVKQLAINDPLTKSAIDYRVQLAVGTSVRIKPNIMFERLRWSPEDNRRVRREIKELWKMFMEADERWSDASGLHTISEQAAQHTRIFETEGEAFSAVFELGESRRSPLSFALGNIDPDRVRNPMNNNFDEMRVRGGILKSRRGFPLGYFVHDYHRNDSRRFDNNGEEAFQFIASRNRDTGREQFIHSFVQVTSDLSRGISSLASCLNLSCQKSQYIDAALEDAISKAGLTFILKSNASNITDLMEVLGNVDDWLTDKDGGALQEYMARSKVWHDTVGIQHKGNRIARLMDMEQLEGFSADQAGGATFETFSETIDTIAASCHGLSVEEYRQRWNDTNFSGARSGKLYVWNMVQSLRAAAPWRFVRKAYCLFLEDMILQGRLRLPGFDSAFQAWEFFLANKEAITCVEFFGSPKDEIDRAKTADAYLAEGQLGVATWESYANEVLGRDWEDILDQHIEEVKTTYEKLVSCGETPTWNIADVVTHRLFAGNAFLARKDLRDSGALDDPDNGGIAA